MTLLRVDDAGRVRYSGGTAYVQFWPNGAYNTGTEAGDCANRSVQNLAQAGKAFN